MVQEHDPYGEMLEGAKESTRPSLPGDESRKKEEATQKKASSELAKSELQEAELNAGGGLYKNGASAKEREESAGGFRTFVGGKGGKGKGLLGGKFKAAKASLAAVLVLGLGLIVVAAVVLTTPIFTIGHLDFNLQDALGFTKTSGILQKLATRIIEKKLSKGEVPSALANDLAEHGINVGQVTANGDFVRTDKFIANVENLKDVASLGHYEIAPSEGELAILYDGKVITADEFVATVESDMRMFADYTEALDISARYYYSDDVEKVYEQMGLSRGIFADWKDLGDAEQNKEKFNEMMEEALSNNSDLVLNAFTDSSGESTSRLHINHGLIARPDEGSNSPLDNVPFEDTTDVTADSSDENNGVEMDISDSDSAESIIHDVAQETKGASATSKAAQLLNAAISAGEPYLAASAFVGIESPIQQARIEGTGPVNELMNMLNVESTVTYTNIVSGEVESKKSSILTTGNFVAAVSGGKFSMAEAANFSRDRANLATSMDDDGIIRQTVISTDGQKKSSILMPISFGDSANEDQLMVLTDSVSMAMIDKNSDLIKSQVGGNRIVEGGSFLSNMINSHVIGAMPSDEATIATYNREARTEMERLAAAERATKSPFDISSPYTFMGSIAHGFANAMIQSGSKGGLIANSIGTVASMTDSSAKDLWSSVMADGEDDTDFGTTYGEYCNTAKSVGAEGDIYCTPHGTVSTGYMDYDEDDWKNELEDLDDSGEIKEDSGLADFTTVGMERWSTVGVRSAESCQRYRDNHPDNVFKSLLNGIADWIGIYDVCDGIEDVGTGVDSVFTEDNEKTKKYAGYVLYDKVSSYLDGTVSKVSAFKEKYYKEHPLDNSRAGKIARISGMTKQEAEVALAYADYLTFIAKYNPAERYAFGVDLLPPDSHEPLVEHASRVAVDLYVMWYGRTEYDDLRTRTRVA